MYNLVVTKEELERLEKDLKIERKSVWSQVDENVRKEIFSYADGYKNYISVAKTERENVDEIVRLSKNSGFIEIDKASEGTRRLIWQNKGKCIALVHLGKRGLNEGIKIIATHIDAPRLDLKQMPLYEEFEMAYLKTHYYGGIKKYQWLSRPLAIHGVVVKTDGSSINVVIGEDRNDPVFSINDLLPHLAGKVQGEKKLPEAFPAEKLNVLVGGIPITVSDNEKKNNMKDLVKLSVLYLLNSKYGIKEEDLISAELEIVPAGPARDVGLDAAFVGGYGQDDRSCAYASLQAILNLNEPEFTCISLFLDKEEIGSDGNTGANSRVIDNLLFDLIEFCGSELKPNTLSKIYRKTRSISGDVTAGIDPDYQEVHEKRNDALMGYGICLTKYTGHKGKYSANDAHAEFVGYIRRVWNERRVIWQSAGLGKVDEGGGGTVAKYLAYLGMDIIDAGVPLLGMHSPFEIAHKADLYMTYKGYIAFFEANY